MSSINNINDAQNEIRDLKHHVDSLVQALQWYVNAMSRGSVTPVQAYIRFREILETYEEWRSEESFMLEEVVRLGTGVTNIGAQTNIADLWDLSIKAKALLERQGVKF